jgi:hypothetical protein
VRHIVVRRGIAPRITDAELVTLAAMQTRSPVLRSLIAHDQR